MFLKQLHVISISLFELFWANFELFWAGLMLGPALGLGGLGGELGGLGGTYPHDFLARSKKKLGRLPHPPRFLFS